MHEASGAYRPNELDVLRNEHICRRTLAIVGQHPQHDGHMRVLVGDMLCNSPDISIADLVKFRADPILCGVFARRLHEQFTRKNHELLRGKSLPMITNAMASDLVCILLASSVESIHEKALNISRRIHVRVPDVLINPVRFDDVVEERGVRITVFHAGRIEALDAFILENAPVRQKIAQQYRHRAKAIQTYREKDQLRALEQYGKKREE